MNKATFGELVLPRNTGVSRAWLIVALIAMLAGIAPARAQTFGRTDVGGIPSAGLSADHKRGSKFSVPESGVVLALCAFLDGNGGVSGSQNIRLALYRDNNGTPGAKVVDSAPREYAAGYPASWSCHDVGWYPISAGTYWIVIHSGSNAGVVRDYGDGPANWYGNADAFTDGAASTFGGGSAGTGTLSVYAAYRSDLKVAGRTTVGTIPSNGMTADFKRGSSFTLSEPARLDGLTVYLDAKGGAAGAAKIRAVLYRDQNGVPGAKVSESREVAWAAGPSWEVQSAGRWTTFFMNVAQLDAGKYWIVLHTGGVGGVLRNYADGSGNWYGNGDNYDDGATNPFGPGSAGNGTISAFVVYTAGPFVTYRFGRTTVGSAPSKGLSANYIRGSQVFIRAPFGCVVTAFYAYLDGNGGAAGSQKLRMALYGAERLLGDDKAAESDVVTLPAGSPPAWVKFPVSGASPDGYYRLMIHSGDTGGVARDYGGDGPANWLGKADTFSDGAAPSFDGSTADTGTGTLSVYAECVGH